MVWILFTSVRFPFMVKPNRELLITNPKNITNSKWFSYIFKTWNLTTLDAMKLTPDIRRKKYLPNFSAVSPAGPDNLSSLRTACWAGPACWCSPWLIQLSDLWPPILFPESKKKRDLWMALQSHLLISHVLGMVMWPLIIFWIWNKSPTSMYVCLNSDYFINF